MISTAPPFPRSHPAETLRNYDFFAAAAAVLVRQLFLLVLLLARRLGFGQGRQIVRRAAVQGSDGE
jgi:hypothetical protein